jgi:hypothetical protein
MSGSERINMQPEVGPKGAAPKGRRKSKYYHQWLRAGAHEKGTNELWVSGGELWVNSYAGRSVHTLLLSPLPLHRHAGAELFLGARPQRGSLKLGDKRSG